MKIKFTTLSSIILSPRMEKALYKDIDFKKIDENIKNLKLKKVNNINIIYPFYSYEDRGLLSESEFSYVKEYYIPASSLKGALLVGKKCEDENILRSEILFRDINISKEYIELKNLYKFQYLYQEQVKEYKTPKFETFFPGVAIEMIGKGKGFESEILFRTETLKNLFEKKLEENVCITRNKLDNYIKEIEQRIKDINLWIKDGKLKEEGDKKEDYIIKLEEIKCNIKNLIDRRKKVIFLGGYKGILGSLTNRWDENKKIKNGFYIDEESMLPYGLVELNIGQKYI